MKLRDFVAAPALGIRLAPGTSAPAGYLDGAEGYLLDRLTGATDRATGSPELDALVHDWATEYHLSALRATLFDAFEFGAAGGARVLELGAGCGAVTRWLGEHCGEVHAIEGDPSRARVARARCADLDAVTVYAGNFSELDEHGGFDVVTLIGVLEYAHLYHPEHGGDAHAAALANLRVARRALGGDGVLVLAIENALGLKYLGGAREDHSGRPWDSVHGYPDPARPFTWNRRALEALVRSAGFDAAEFFLPYPDYKLPSTILREAAARDVDGLHNWIPTPAPDRGHRREPLAFAETLAQREVARAGLLGDLANSFLVLAFAGDAAAAKARLGIDTDWVARHWSLSRRPAFAKRVTLRDGAAAVEVERPRMIRGGVAEPAVDAARALGLRQRIAAEPYRAGDRILYDVVRDLVASGFGDAWVAHLRAFATWLDAAYGVAGRPGVVRPDALDATWWNVVADPATSAWHAIDLEWELGEALPRDFVLWRMLRHFALRHATELPAPWRDADPVAFADHWIVAAVSARGRGELEAYRELDALVGALAAPGPLPPAAEALLAEAETAGELAAAGVPWVLTFADALDAPLLRAWAEAVRPDEAVALAVYAPGWSEIRLAERVEAVAAAAAVRLDGYDVVGLPLEPGRGSDAAVAERAAAVLGARPPGAFAALPRFGAGDGRALRSFLAAQAQEAATAP